MIFGNGECDRGCFNQEIMQIKVTVNGEEHKVYGTCDGGDFTIESVMWRDIDITDVVFDDFERAEKLATLAAEQVVADAIDNAMNMKAMFDTDPDKKM